MHISIDSGLLSAIFLILITVSAAVVASMVALALFDRAFIRKKPSIVAEDSESERPDEAPPTHRMTRHLRVKPLVAPRRNRRADPQAGFGPDTQKVRRL